MSCGFSMTVAIWRVTFPKSRRGLSFDRRQHIFIDYQKNSCLHGLPSRSERSIALTRLPRRSIICMEGSMGQAQNLRGRAFEARVYALLSRLVDRHPGFIEVHAQPEIPLLNGQIKKPDFEWVYRTEQANHELIECQSRDRSSSEIAEKIRQIKTLSSRNRFIFVFEDLTRLSPGPRRVWGRCSNGRWSGRGSRVYQ
jgi:hypothetical protein